MAIEWNVKNAINRDVERQHLNKILADIRSVVDSLLSKKSDSSSTSGVKALVGEMVSNNSESGISVTYNNQSEVLDFAVSGSTLSLEGDVSGTGTVTPGEGSTITVTIDPDKVGITDTVNDGDTYWRKFGEWEEVGVNLKAIRELAADGFPAADYDATTETAEWFMRTMTAADGITITNPTGAAGNPTFEFDADTGKVSFLPGATYSTVQKFVDTMHSPGIITGGDLSDLGSGNVRISAGTMMIRIADDDVSDLPFADFAQTDFAVPNDQLTRFFGVVYNGGSPIVEMRTSFNWNKDSEIPLGSAVRLSSTITVITNNKYRMGDPITNIIQRFDAVGPTQRDNSIGGLALGETGTRNVTVSAGRIWSRLSDFDTTSKNSSTDTMLSAYFNGTNLTVTSGLTQWDNLQYNDMGTGSLVTMGNNKYANLWFFMSFDGTKYGFAYGTAEYNTIGDAATEGVPPYLTQNFFNQALLLGRFIFQKSAATADIIESAFVTPFTSAAINTHNNLGGLQGGTTNEFYHLTAAQFNSVGTVIVQDSIVDAVTNVAPSQNAVFDALAGKQPLDATLTALAGQNWAANALPIGTGADTVSQVTFSANTFPARGSAGDLVAHAVTDDALLLLADADVPRLSTANSWNANQTFGGAIISNTTNLFIRTQTADGADTGSILLDSGAGNQSTARGAFMRVNGNEAASNPGSVIFVSGNGADLIFSGGTLRPNADNTYDFGTSSFRWMSMSVVNIAQSGAMFETGVVTPAQLTANTDNWVVTGLSAARTIRASTDASRNLTGIANPTAGQVVRLCNVGAFSLVLVHDATSTAANRFLCPNNLNVTVRQNGWVEIWYDSVSSRWRVQGI